MGGPIEAAVETDTYFDIVTKATRATGTVKRKVSSTSTRVLHVINLPAGSDMQRMREQLSRMERRINRLTEEVTDADGPHRARPVDGTPPDRTPSTDAMAPTLNPADLVARVTRDVERSVLRARNGVRYVRGSYRGKVGATPKDVVWERGQGPAVALPERTGPIRPARADRAQPREQELHPRPAPR